MNNKFIWTFAAIAAAPLTAIKMLCDVPMSQMCLPIILSGILLAILHERKYGHDA
jgi:H+/Cl- antiporter ClcA